MSIAAIIGSMDWVITLALMVLVPSVIAFLFEVI
jgi:hypothetical protein